MSTTERETGRSHPADARPGGPAVKRSAAEMPHWTDLDGVPGPCRGRAVAALLGRVVTAGRRVLVAGPHEIALVAVLAGPGARVTWLLRSRRDALRAAEAPGPWEVVCGGPAALDGQSYDLVVALDGLERVVSAEGRQSSWAQALDALTALLAPGGTLLLGVANPLGVHELTAATPSPHDHADRHWDAPATVDPDRPGSADRLRDRLADRGLRVERLWLGFPDPTAPAVLLDARVAQGDPVLPAGLDGLVTAALAGAWPTIARARTDGPAGAEDRAQKDGPARAHDRERNDRQAGADDRAQTDGRAGADDRARNGGSTRAGATPVERPWLTDPRPIAADAVANGLGEAFAPLWLVLATRAAVGEDGAEPAENLPEIVYAEPAGPYAVTWLISGGTRRVPPPAPARGVVYGVDRDTALLDGPVPRGPGFEQVLLEACRRRDTPRVRRLLTAYASWLREQTAARDEVDGAAAATAFDGLAVTAGGLAPLDPSWSAGVRPYPVVLARALRRFAVRLLTSGAVHPWPSTLDADALARVLTGAAGQHPDPVAVAAAVELEADLAAAAAGLDPEERAALRDRLTAVDTGTAPADGAYRELWLAHERLRGEFDHARAVVAEQRGTLRVRADELRAARGTIARLKGSVSFRLGRALLAPARLVASWGRALTRRRH